MVVSTPENDPVVIVGAARTPIGSYGGCLSTVPATELGATAIKGALIQASLPSSCVEACYMGNVCSAGLGQAPARQAAISAGLPSTCVCTTVNKVCSSGLKAITLAAQDLLLGQAKVVIAGGMENMSQIPYYINKARFGHRMGNSELVDGMLNDALIDPYSRQHMGTFAEKCAKRYKFSRKQQDDLAKESYKRALSAWKQGLFAAEVVEVPIKGRKKDLVITKDEECARIKIEEIDGMWPAFQKDSNGTVTSGNSSGLNDGAAAVVMMRQSLAKEKGLEILGTILGYTDTEQEPEEFTTSPSKAIPKALEKAKIKIGDVDVFEVNEAFSVVSLANARLLGLNPAKVNVNGGAVALGHPVGCSGARIVVTLLNVLRQLKARRGVASICNGGGGATAIVVERHGQTNSSL